MILIFEQDTRSCNGKRFQWTPELFIGKWNKKLTWRFCWGVWSLSYYQSEGLQDFMEHIIANAARWAGG